MKSILYKDIIEANLILILFALVILATSTHLFIIDGVHPLLFILMSGLATVIYTITQYVGDEQQRRFAYFFSTPIGRKEYVTLRYLSPLLIGGFIMLIAIIQMLLKQMVCKQSF